MSMKTLRRGQAFVETAIAMPLLLGSLFFLFWVAKYVILQERLEHAERLQQVNLNAGQIYQSYSLASLYFTLRGENTTPTCTNTAPAELFSSQTPFELGGVLVPGNTIWASPLVATPHCVEDTQQVLQGNGFSHDYLFSYISGDVALQFTVPWHSSFMGSTANGAVGISSHTLGSLSSAPLRSGTLCFDDLSSALNASLVVAAEGTADTTTTPFVADNSTYSETPDTAPLSLSDTCVKKIQ